MPNRRTIFIKAASLLLLAPMILSIAAGCAPKKPLEAPWEKNARVLIEHADALFAKKQYDEASKALDSFFASYPKSRSTDRALHLMGEIRLTLRDYPRALSYYKDIIEKFPASTFIIDARYKLGLCYFELKEYDLAVANLRDRSRITDPSRLRRSAEMLAASYLVKKDYLGTMREYVALVDLVPDEKQKSGYRDRVREIVDKSLAESELREISSGAAYPSDLALLRIAQLLIEQRKYRDSIKTAKDFLERFPGHPEKVRAELLINEATTKLSTPRYLLGALVPQTGQLAFVGDRVLKGVQLAINAYNTYDPDNRADVIVKDTEGSPEKTAAALAELAPKGIVAAIGPLLTKEVEALAPVAVKLGVPVITPAASGAGIGALSPWIFRNALTNSSQAAAAAGYALRQNLKKFVILYPDDSFHRGLTRLFTKELEQKAEVIADVSYPAEANDFGPYIKKIIEIDLRSRKIPIPEDDAERKKLFQEYIPSFDALYLPGDAEKIGLLIPQLAFYNIKGVAVIGSNSWHSPDLLERAGRHAEGMVFVDGFFQESADPAVKSVVDSYRSAYQEEPDIFSAQAYDAVAIVLSLIKEGKDSPLAVRDGLLSLKEFPGISGTTTFEGTGEAKKGLFLIKVENGKFVQVKE